MIRATLTRIEDWAFDDESVLLSLVKMGVVILVPVILCAMCFAKLDRAARTGDIKDCIAAGGAWKEVGQHTVMSTVMVGKTVVPQRRIVIEYGCVTP